MCVRFRLNVHYRLRVKARPFVSFISFGFRFIFVVSLCVFCFVSMYSNPFGVSLYVICVFVFVLNFFVVVIVVVVVASVFIIVSSGFSINSKTSPNTPLLHRLILGQVV